MHKLNVFVITVALAGSSSAFADINPWDFNVFSRSTIGSANSPYGSDYQGAAGAVGNAYFGGFELRAIGGSSPSLSRSFYGGAQFTLFSGTIHGSIESAGTVSVSSYNVTGSVWSGGNLAGNGGTLNGSATLTGVNTSSSTINGSLNTGVAYNKTVDLGVVSSYFLNTSNYFAAQPNTNTGAPGATTYSYNGGGIQVGLHSGLNVISISAADLNNAYSVTVTGAGTLIVNVLGGTAELNNTDWFYNGGASSSTTMLNYNQATTLNMPWGANRVNILAPNAAVSFPSGLVEGNLIVGSLMGGNYSGGQVNWTGSGYAGLIPAPGAAGVVAITGLAAMRRKRR
ncbi:MAG: choice-of-anchor A family protein [Phycisphaerales bacterium]